MKLIYLIVFIFSVGIQAEPVSYLVEVERPEKNPHQGQFQNTTRDALLSIDSIAQTADNLVLKIKNITFGEYADNLLFIAPLVTGDVELNANNNLRLYYNHFRSQGGVRYQLSF